MPQVGGIFTPTAFSPGSSWRQFPSRDAIRAGLNLPVKEFRYLRTLIVRADIDQGFGLQQSSKRQSPQPLTFWHWSGVTPYTSSYELAGSCVFDKQSPGIFSCGPDKSGRSLLRTYGRCFAEFLHEESPVRLGLLALPTCVGLRYGPSISNFRNFSWKPAHPN